MILDRGKAVQDKGVSQVCCQSGQIRIQNGDKVFYITETVNGFRVRVGEGEYREIEIRPVSKEEIYISLR